MGGPEVYSVTHGSGRPVLALHGAGVDHREIEAALEAVVPASGYRRIYPDLPAMGRTGADGVASNADVVAVLARFVEDLDVGPVRVLGHSYGAYLARGLAASRPSLVSGLALICPLGEGGGEVPAPTVAVDDPAAYDELEPSQREGFAEYFVVRTPAAARRYRDHVVPGIAAVDPDALERVFGDWALDLGSEPFMGPTLVVAGRLDATVGFADAAGLLDRYPRATLAVVDGAGHALPHESPDVFGALVRDWLER